MMTRFIRLRSIRSKLIFAFLAAFTPLAVLHFTAYFQQYQSRKDFALHSHAALAYSVSASVTTFVEGIVAAHEAVAKTIEEGAGRRTLTRCLQSICSSHPGIESSCILSIDGKVISAVPEAAVPDDVMRRREIVELTKGAMFSVSGLTEGRFNTPVFIVASVVTPENRKPIIVRSAINANRLKELIPYSVKYQCAVVVVDSSGQPFQGWSWYFQGCIVIRHVFRGLIGRCRCRLSEMWVTLLLLPFEV